MMSQCNLSSRGGHSGHGRDWQQLRRVPDRTLKLISQNWEATKVKNEIGQGAAAWPLSGETGYTRRAEFNLCRGWQHRKHVCTLAARLWVESQWQSELRRASFTMGGDGGAGARRPQAAASSVQRAPLRRC